MKLASSLAPRRLPRQILEATRDRNNWLRHPAVSAVLVFVVMLSLATPLMAVVQNWHHQMGVYDEVAYLDYLYKADHGHFVVGKGEHVARFTEQTEACRGIGTVPRNESICSGLTAPSHYSLDTADIDPPTYYVLTAAGARVIRGLGLTKDFLVSGRLVGIFWGALASTLMFLFCRRLGASGRMAALISAVVLVLPLDVTQWTYVTPHALELPVAISAAWVVVNWSEGGGRWWHLALVALIAPLVKATTVLGIAIGILTLLGVAYWYYRNDRLPPRRLLSGAGIMIAGLGVSTVAWVLVRNHYALMSGNEFPQFDVKSFHIQFLTSTLGSFLKPTIAGGAATFAYFLAAVTYGVPMTRLSDVEAPISQRMLTGSMLTAGLIGPWLFVLSNYILIGQFVLLPARYGLAVIGVALALWSVALRGRLAEFGVAALVLVLLTIDLAPQFW